MTRADPAPERFVVLVAFSDEKGGLGRHPLAPQWPQQMHTTVLLQDVGGRTLVTVLSAPHEASAAEREMFVKGRPSMTQGWGGTFDRLDAFFAAP